VAPRASLGPGPGPAQDKQKYEGDDATQDAFVNIPPRAVFLVDDLLAGLARAIFCLVAEVDTFRALLQQVYVEPFEDFWRSRFAKEEQIRGSKAYK